MMDSLRRNKYSRQIQKDLGDILLRNSSTYYGNNMVSVTEVEVSPDLSLARVYFSIFPDANADSVMEKLESRKSEIRGHLGRLIGKQARKVPELAFFNDNGESNAQKIESLINSLEIPPDHNTEED